MLATTLLTVVIFFVAALGLGLGAWLRDRPIQGSCGGAACLKKLGIGCVGGCAKKENHHG